MILRYTKASPLPAAAVDLFSHIESITEHRDPNSTALGKQVFARMLGQANEFKEGDYSIGVAAVNQQERDFARSMLARTKICDIERFPYHVDHLYALCREVDPASAALTNTWELSRLKQALLAKEHDAILPGLSSDVIGCVVKLMSNDELIQLGSQIFHPMPGSKLGSKGYFGARVQPNSATDDPEDIFWQVLNAFSFAVGDVMLGTNPVSSDPHNVLRTQLVLKDIVDTFQLSNILPHCVLSHIDIQAKIEREHPGSTALWFQSIAGSDSANQTFDLPILTMLQHAATRTGRFGLYLETGQGADYTNGHSRGIDMVMHDARKFGFARALKHRVAQAQQGNGGAAEIYINNVAGFIGPECFRTKEQLVRVCLEDIAMGKLHGLTVGLDVCATLHMDVSLDDLDWCLDQILPANPAWAMALPTKNDPMLSYLTTSYQDHVRLRNKFGYKVDDAMWRFFTHELQVVDAATGKPTQRFGDPAWVYLKYYRRKFGNDEMSDADILNEVRQRINSVQVPLALGHGENAWDVKPELDAKIRNLCIDAKVSLWRELSPSNSLQIPGFDSVIALETNASSRQDYVFHPEKGESLSEGSVQLVERCLLPSFPVVAIVISDGLCVDAILDQAHLDPFLESLQRVLSANQIAIHPQAFVLRNGRVRAGYQIGKLLFAHTAGCICHVIGERPGNGHHTFSAYMTCSKAWSTKQVDHDITRVVSGIADTAYDPHVAGEECAKIILESMM